MEINIGKYKVSRRTSYSKIYVYDAKTGKDVTSENEEIGIKVFDDYAKLSSNPNYYFNIEGDSIVGVSPCLSSENISYVFVPEGIKDIAVSAFKCGEFEFIDFPNTLQTIRAAAFSNCKNLRYVNLPPSVDFIGVSAFRSCSSLEKVNLGSSIDLISGNSFYGCDSLKEVYMPDTVEQIDDSAFYGCVALKHINLSKNLKVLGEYVFDHCISLSGIDLPEGLKRIDKFCFSDCNLESIIVPDSVEEINYMAFTKNTALKNVKLPNNLRCLSSSVFADCKNLESIYLPDSITTIGSNVFKSAFKLKEINIPKNLEKYEFRVFMDSDIKTLIFNHSLEKLGECGTIYGYDFIYDSKIERLVIDKNCKKITPSFLKQSGTEIKYIDYLGTEEEFKKFKSDNLEFLDKVPKAKINFLEKIKETDIEKER